MRATCVLLQLFEMEACISGSSVLPTEQERLLVKELKKKKKFTFQISSALNLWQEV